VQGKIFFAGQLLKMHRHLLWTIPLSRVSEVAFEATLNILQTNAVSFLAPSAVLRNEADRS
jgi:hypothetical protein